MVQITGTRTSLGSSKSLASSGRLRCSVTLCLFMVVVSLVSVSWFSTVQRIRRKFEKIPAGPSDEQLQKLAQVANRNIAKAEAKLEEENESALKKNAKKDNSKTVAFAVSVTGCGSDPITEGAAVLKHSIHRASVRGEGAGVDDDLKGKYDYEMFAIYHPDAASCALPLATLGYNLLERNVFLNVDDIQGDYLREKIRDNGCCGEKELIKLEAYTLIDYPIVVHLDLDVLILKPLDELFDMMLFPNNNNNNNKAAGASSSIMWPEKPIPPVINAFYTYDYNMVNPRVKYKPVQGGFLVLRPSLEVYEEFKGIVSKGDFRDSSGWGGKVGPFYGSMTFQGIIPYFYDFLHPDQSLELNRCIFNQMCDNPRTGKTVNDVLSGDCKINTPDDKCEDCRDRPLEDVASVHFTLCQKPWICMSHQQNQVQHRLCRKLTREWYRIRSDMEKSWGRSGFGPYIVSQEKFGDAEHFFGFCKYNGNKGYSPIQKPYGRLQE